MSVELTDQQLKAAIMQLLVKKGRWGVAHYLPVDTIVNWLGKKVRRNGKRVTRSVKDLVNNGYLFVHKRGETVSLNPARSGEIMELLKSVPQER